MAKKAEEIENDPDAGIELDIDMNDLNMTLFSKRHVALCRRMQSLATLTPEDFLLVMRKAKLLNADPLNGDLYVRRSGDRINVMSSIAGMRTYAKQTGEYAGDDRPPEMEVDDNARGDNNPQGIISCTVGVFRFVQGEFRYHAHTVFWNDYVPLTNGRLSGLSSWAQIPFVMISKVAEAGALRKAFPELGSTYIEEEMGKAKQQTDDQQPGHEFGFQSLPPAPTQHQTVVTSGLDANAPFVPPQPKEFATEFGIVPPTAAPAVGKEDSIHVNWLNGDTEKAIPVSQFFSLVNEFLRAHLTNGPQFVVEWFKANMTARERFWQADERLSRHRDASKLKSLLTEAESLYRARSEGQMVDEPEQQPAPRARRTRQPEHA